MATSSTTDREPAPPADRHTELLVLGSGPGGYAAAFRAADLGLQVTLVERFDSLGGVCLNVGCIPSKALLHAADVLTAADAGSAIGINFAAPQVDLDALRGFRDSVVGRLTSGLEQLAVGRKVRVLNGHGAFVGPRLLTVGGAEGSPMTVSFDQAIVAVGSRPTWLPFLPPPNDRVITSTGALALRDVPERLIVIGGGIIGLEMACVYDALGSAVTIVEMADRLIAEADDDLVRPLARRIRKRYADVLLSTTVEQVAVTAEQTVAVTVAGAERPLIADRVLVAIGRTANIDGIGLDLVGVDVGADGRIVVDDCQRTSVPHIFAIGDVAPGPMLAHKASAEGHVAAEVAAGVDGAVSDVRAIPSVAYTDPEVAWVGLTERRGREQNIPHAVARFPWTASGRALTTDSADGQTKLIYEPESGRVLGGGAVGRGAGELIAEITLAIELGANITDIALTVHPHPTLSESFGLAAELADGSITDLPNPQPRRRLPH